MNIFALDQDPVVAAQLQCDKHVVKMILESAQLLSTAHRLLDGTESVIKKNNRRKKVWTHPDSNLDSLLYSATHVNHPSAIWCRETSENYKWLYQHFIGLCNEYTRRYGRTHLSDTKLRHVLATLPHNIKRDGLSVVRLAMPDAYRHHDPVVAYRRYYASKKTTIDMRWTKSEEPSWMTDVPA